MLRAGQAEEGPGLLHRAGHLLMHGSQGPAAIVHVSAWLR
eukprot:CAMPEP_0117680514 /NCGR_PEP_ID=MMETSP0804-20121206/18402_1 /TAXON_ID=1074897 /ORGANISM="Tetraselmis astigmatica, Strain CCMP880" /LENGTH=39 /DNA_ID= /DNA_START= /DNA_END= /DNA_ORIENTATION=